MSVEDFRAKSDDQLKDSLVDLKKEQFNLRFRRATGQVEDTSRNRTIRRDIARVKTVLTERAKGA